MGEGKRREKGILNLHLTPSKDIKKCPLWHPSLDLGSIDSLTLLFLWQKKSVMTLLYASLAELKSPLEKRNGKKKKTKQNKRECASFTSSHFSMT
jgi:hypothetical protein